MQPVSSAGASFWSDSANGKFQGAIAPTTPTGCRRTSSRLRSPSRSCSHGKVAAWAACQSRIRRAASGCHSAIARGDPTSSVIVRANSCGRSPISSAARASTAARSSGVAADHGAEGRTRGPDRAVDVLRAREVRLTDRRFGRRVDDVDDAAAGGRGPGAVDVRTGQDGGHRGTSSSKPS